MLLLILMAEDAELSNREITEKYARGLELTGIPRKQLVDEKLIECRKNGRAYFFTLSDKGWSWCREELTRTVPNGSGSAGHALYAVLGGLDRFLQRTGHSLAHTFGNPPDSLGDRPDSDLRPVDDVPTARPTADEIEREIRVAYRRLAAAPGSWVSLADIRDQLPGFAKQEVDGVLRLMVRMAGVQIEEETNQKALTHRDRAAAVSIGGRDQHVLAIGGQ